MSLWTSEAGGAASAGRRARLAFGDGAPSEPRGVARPAVGAALAGVGAVSGGMEPLMEFGLGRFWTAAYAPDGSLVSLGRRGLFRWDADGANPTEGVPIQWPDDWDCRGCPMVVSPDGSRVLTVDGPVRLWNASTGELIHTLEHDGLVESVALSPDGKQVLTGCDDGSARLWNASTGALIRTIEHDDGVTSVAFSPDGMQVLTGCEDGSARLWNTSTGALIRTFEHTNQVTSVAFSPDGTRVLTGGGGWVGPVIKNFAQLWDSTNGELIRTFAPHHRVESVAFSPDGAQVLVAGDWGAWMWNASTGALIHGFSDGGVLKSVAFSPDGSRLLGVVAGLQLKSVLWETSSGALIGWRIFRDHTHAVEDAIFSSDGTRVLTGGGGWSEHGYPFGCAQLWNPSSGALIRTFEHDHPVSSVAFSPDRTRILTGGGGMAEDLSSYGFADVWNASTGAHIRWLNSQRWATSVAYSSNGTRILTGSGGWHADRYFGYVRLWNAFTWELIHSIEHDGFVLSVALSPDGTTMMTSDGAVRLWNAKTGAFIHSFEQDDLVQSLAFSPDGDRVLTGGGLWDPDEAVYTAGMARLWTASTGALIRTFEHDDVVKTVAFSPDGTRVLTGCDDGTARLWNASTGALIRAFEHDDVVNSVAFSPDGTRVLTGSPDGIARLWATDLLPDAGAEDAHEPNNNLEEARLRAPIHPGQTLANLRSNDEDWYRIVFGSEESIRVRVLFQHSKGNLNAELYDPRSFDRSGWPARVGESYSPSHPWVWNLAAGDGPEPVWTTGPWGPATADDEWMTYVNNTGATELFLRVYGQDWATNDDYSVVVDSLGADDEFEPNNELHQATTIEFGTPYEGLIGKNNDYYRVDVQGRDGIRVRVACYALLGTMYFEVYERLSDGSYRVIEHSKMYEPNRYEAQRLVCVQGMSEVVVRVYPSVRRPNVYNLAVEDVSGVEAGCP